MKAIDGIRTDAELVDVIDSLKHEIKRGIPYSPMRDDFNSIINAFIARWHLDGDPHAFATLPASTEVDR